jgi:capsular exopolysaccharide synthesis family protein
MVSAQGSSAEDLPVILEYLVAAYMKLVGEDSREAGRESVELIEKLQKKLIEDQRNDETRYETLIAQLNLTSENERNAWSNPHTAEVTKLKELRDSLRTQLRDIEGRINQARTAIEIRSDRPDLVKLLAMDARRYFQFQAMGAAGRPEASEEMLAITRLRGRISNIEDEISMLEAEKMQMLESVGPNHSSVLSVESRIKVKRTVQEKAQQDLDRIIANQGAVSRPVEPSFESGEKELLQLYSSALVRDREDLRIRLDEATKELEIAETNWSTKSADVVELNVLKGKIEERRLAIASILEKLSTINLITNNYNTVRVRIIDSAGIGVQIYPTLTSFLTTNAAIAAFIGLALAFLIDRADMSFRTPLQIQELLRAPVICQVPKIERGKLPAGYKGSHCLVTHLKPLSNSAEAFRSGRAAIMITASQIHGKVFLFTSPQPGDGKSTISSNFALSLAQLGKKVILVDADFRRPRVAQYLGEEPKPGFCDHLNGTPLEDCIRTSTVHNNLMFLPTGGHPKNPGEIVNGIELGSVIDKLRQEFDYVIIDSPPLNPVADSSALASIVDGVYMVIRIRRGGVVAASRARDQLDLVNAKLLGVIVNGLDNNPHYYDHGYYGYNYQRGYGKYYESSSKDLIDV